ncbi:LytR C-terminal domain-containing protein [Streptacidiphilus carbonis]|uniref:LytR C-terminal domain-containing protein n=1 Tax=Streptacidiphilus carbonis TaxID=105422 RepID=UPI000694B9F6|nr:LytR C-terminal domain-containing protein [Streptacidiphilus carbonis]
MQRGHGTGADPGFDGVEAVDPADLWVLDPVTGEYRMRLPGEPPPPAPPRPAQDRTPRHPAAAPWPTPGSTPDSTPASRPAPARTPAAEPRPPRRAARRRQQARGGPWLAGVAGFLLLVGGGCIYVLVESAHGGSAQAASTGSAAASPSASCSAAPTRAAVPVPEPAVSGSFLAGAKAAPLDTRVTVLNGSGTLGAAESVLSWMQNTEKWLRTSNGGPADRTASTSLVYAPDHISQARTVAAAMGLPASALHGDGKTTGLRDPMVLTLGQDFHGIGKPFAAPTPAAAAGTSTTAACGSH